MKKKFGLMKRLNILILFFSFVSVSSFAAPKIPFELDSFLESNLDLEVENYTFLEKKILPIDFYFELAKEMHRKIGPSENDCVMRTLAFFSYISLDALKAWNKSVWGRNSGLSPKFIEKSLEEQLEGFAFKYQKVGFFELGLISEGSAVILSVRKEEFSQGHHVVVGKKDGELWFFDLQFFKKARTRRGKDQIGRITNKLDSMYVFSSGDFNTFFDFRLSDPKLTLKVLSYIPIELKMTVNALRKTVLQKEVCKGVFLKEEREKEGLLGAGSKRVQRDVEKLTGSGFIVKSFSRPFLEVESTSTGENYSLFFPRSYPFKKPEVYSHHLSGFLECSPVKRIACYLKEVDALFEGA